MFDIETYQNTQQLGINNCFCLMFPIFIQPKHVKFYYAICACAEYVQTKIMNSLTEETCKVLLCYLYMCRYVQIKIVNSHVLL